MVNEKPTFMEGNCIYKLQCDSVSEDCHIDCDRYHKFDLPEFIDFTHKNQSNRIETRGRKQKYDEPLTETVCFNITAKQKEILNEILKEKKIDVSSFVRALIFGE